MEPHSRGPTQAGPGSRGPASNTLKPLCFEDPLSESAFAWGPSFVGALHLWGPPFCGGPVQLHLLHMPKSGPAPKGPKGALLEPFFWLSWG
jgi:hypothetical protein